MKLYRPYEDELVGSMLSRAARNSGLCLPTLLEALTGRARFTHSFVVVRHPRIAEAFGMDVEDFIRLHTTTAYALAFMPVEHRARLWDSALSAEPRASYMSGIAKNLTSTNAQLRFCPACVSADIEAFGDSYWHREHQLPSVSICRHHRQGLLSSPIPLRARLPAPPPHECEGCYLRCDLPLNVQLAISNWSAGCLNSQLQGEVKWWEWFRERASEAGYQLSQGTNFGERLSRDLERFYSSAFLEDHRCAVDRQSGPQWPARLLRSCSRGIEPLKHVLMAVFLESDQAPTVAKRKEFKARGPRRDRSREDADAVRRVSTAAKLLRKRGSQANLTILLRRAGVEALWRHSYPRLPRLLAWIAEFKASDQYRRWMKVPADLARDPIASTARHGH